MPQSFSIAASVVPAAMSTSAAVSLGIVDAAACHRDLPSLRTQLLENLVLRQRIDLDGGARLRISAPSETSMPCDGMDVENE